LRVFEIAVGIKRHLDGCRSFHLSQLLEPFEEMA
jgi:hypothetical protein